MTYKVWKESNMNEKTPVLTLIKKYNTGLDAIKRAPIVLENTGIKCLRIQDISQNKDFSNWGNTKVSQANFSRFQLKNNYIMIARTGASIGVMKFIDKEYKAVFNNGLIRLIPDENKVDPKYLFYNLKSKECTDHIYGISAGTATQPNMKMKDLLRFKIKVPSIKKQIKIANILSVMDEKIELNNRINQNLEEMAQTLYKRWFVDFEFPTEEGKPYKSSGGEMIDSELGLIPKGWEVLAMKERFSFIRGVEPGSKNYNEKREVGTIPFYRVGDLEQKRPVFVKESLIKEKKIEISDILVSFDGAIGRVGFGLKGSYSTGIRKITDKKNILSGGTIYSIMKSDLIQNKIHEHSNGTTILHAGSSIEFLKVPFSESIFGSFDNLIKPFFERLLIIKEENINLAKIRDELLPRLMSGEIEVPVKD
jgi:type I restriction enzyme S subunit